MLSTLPKISLWLILLLFFSGCTIMPGSHLSTSGKKVVKDPQDAVPLSDLVEIRPITVSLLAKTNAPESVSRSNPQLEAAIEAYDYHIGIGDVLNITVWDHPELTIPAGSFRSSAETGTWVHTDGTIFYPYIGKVMVNGLPLSEVRDVITKRLARYIEKPQVDVNVAAFRSKRAYITGEVNKPGIQPITNIPLTLLEAINRAGGLTDNADWTQITLNHNGSEEKLSLQDLFQQGDLGENRLLLKNDIVHVARNDNLKVFVLGEVHKPSTMIMDRTGMRLTEALSNAGGINEAEADATGIFVIRRTPASTADAALPKPSVFGSGDKIATIFQLNLQDATAMILGTEFRLKPYDVVYVTAVPLSRWNRVVRQLLPTLQGLDDATAISLRNRF
jgi:polysaccharide export outer membrane protein